MNVVARRNFISSRNAQTARLDRIAMPALYICFFLLRWLAYLPSQSSPYAWDGNQYMEIVEGRPFGHVFGQGKPFVVPLLYQLLQANVELMAGVQFLFSFLAWGLLAWRVGALFKQGWMRQSGILIVLAFSATPVVCYWDRSMLSESVSISLLALIMAAGLWLYERWSWARAAVLTVPCLLWAWTRDGNAYVLGLFALLLIVAALFKRVPKGNLVVAVVLMLALGVSLWDADKGVRWKYPLFNVIGMRVLTDPAVTDYFADHGMPVTPALMERAGSYGHNDDAAFYNDPDLAGFREWLQRDGKRTYVSFLLTNPIWLITKPMEDIRLVFATPYMQNYKPLRMGNPLGALASELIAPAGPVFLVLFMAGAAGLFVVLRVGRHLAPSSVVILPLLILFAGIAYGYISWHGDPMEPMRHSVQAVILVRLGLWLLVLLAIERLVRYRASTSLAPAPASGLR